MSRISKKFALTGRLIVAAAVAVATPVLAQATRTWVSGTGSDANPCSRTAPCQTFAGAISKTATGGEINCLDPGGFGGVTITKAISIVCDYTEGGILSAGAGVNGIVVNAPVGDRVFLSGLDWNGAGSAQNGLRVISGNSVHVRNSLIRNYRAANGLGISYQPAQTGGELIVTDTWITDNGTGVTGGGVLIQPTGASSAKVTFENAKIQNNANIGLFVNVTGSTGTGVFVSVENSSIANNDGDGVKALHVAGAQGILVTIDRSNISNNGAVGLLGDGASATMRVGDSTIAGNATGVSRLNASQVKSYGDNRLNGNTAADGTFLAPNVTKL